MDGPNVNWATFDRLQKKLQLEYSSKLLNVGSCGIHIVHNAFKAAISKTGWDLLHKLSALHTLWDEPQLEEKTKSATKQNVYPLPFCAHHWIENVRVCEWAMEIHQFIRQCIDSIEQKESKDPGARSYITVREWSKDKFAKAKLAFIVSTAKPIEKFLKMYQTDSPMIPFLAKDLEYLLRIMMDRFVKQSVMEKATSTQKLCSIVVQTKTITKHIRTLI